MLMRLRLLSQVPGLMLAMVCLDWKRMGRRLSLVAGFADAGVACLLLILAVGLGLPAGWTQALAFVGRVPPFLPIPLYFSSARTCTTQSGR